MPFIGRYQTPQEQQLRLQLLAQYLNQDVVQYGYQVSQEPPPPPVWHFKTKKKKKGGLLSFAKQAWEIATVSPLNIPGVGEAVSKLPTPLRIPAEICLGAISPLTAATLPLGGIPGIAGKGAGAFALKNVPTGLRFLGTSAAATAAGAELGYGAEQLGAPRGTSSVAGIAAGLASPFALSRVRPNIAQLRGEGGYPTTAATGAWERIAAAVRKGKPVAARDVEAVGRMGLGQRGAIRLLLEAEPPQGTPEWQAWRQQVEQTLGAAELPEGLQPGRIPGRARLRSEE